MYRIEIYIKITYDFLSTSFRVTDLPSLYIHTFTRRKGAAHRRWRSNRQRDHQRHRCFSHSQKAAPEPLHTYIHARAGRPPGANYKTNNLLLLLFFLSFSLCLCIILRGRKEPRWKNVLTFEVPFAASFIPLLIRGVYGELGLRSLIKIVSLNSQVCYSFHWL